MIRLFNVISRTLIVLYSHLHVHAASQRHNDKDAWRKEAGMKDAWRIKMQEGRHKKTSLEKYSPLTLLQGFERLACERMLETEHKLHISTPLLWPSRCVFIVLLMLGSTPSGLSEGPLGLVWPSLPHLVSNPQGVCWQLHRGFSECPPRSGVAFPTTSGLYCLEFYWQLLRRVSEVPLGRVWPSLPHLVSTVWNFTGNCSGTQTQLS